MSELERAVHVERENQREEINHNRQKVSMSEKRLKERTDECLARNLSRMAREAEEGEKRLRDDLEHLRSQQEQTLGTLVTRIDALLKRRTKASMNRLDGLLGNRSGSSKRRTHSREASREPRVNFNEHPNRGRNYGSTRGRGNSSCNASGNNRLRGPAKVRGGSIGSRPIPNERPMRDANSSRSSDSTIRTEGKFQSLKRQMLAIKRDILVMQRQWLRRLKP